MNLNSFDTSCQYTDTLFHLDVAALPIQIHDLTDELTQYQYIDTSSVRPSGFESIWYQNFVS